MMNLALRLHEPPTDDDILRLSNENPGYRFERGPDGALEVSPTGTAGGARSARLTHALMLWNERLPERGVVFDSSTGFNLPDGSLISPDGAWIAGARWEAIDEAERERYSHIVPDVVVEIVSQSDRPEQQRAKLERCRRLGARYVLLLDPFRKTTWTDGDAPAGLVLDLKTIE